MATALLIAGLATLFNFVILIHKFRIRRYFDFILDCSLMVCICVLFAGTYSGLVVGMIASMGISLYLLWKPVKFPSVKDFLFPPQHKKGKP